MLELSTLLSLKARTCGTIDCVWDTRCGARSVPHLTRDVCEPWADYTSYLLAGPTRGPPDGLRGRVLFWFRENDMASGSPCLDTVQREAAALLPSALFKVWCIMSVVFLPAAGTTLVGTVFPSSTNCKKASTALAESLGPSIR